MRTTWRAHRAKRLGVGVAAADRWCARRRRSRHVGRQGEVRQGRPRHGRRLNQHAQLQEFVERTGADEVMITSHIYVHAARLRSYEIVAPGR